MTARDQVIDALIRLLENGDEADRCYSARALGMIGDSRAIPALQNRLQDEDIDVCVDATAALGELGDSQATPVLTELLLREPESEVKIAAAEALGRIGDNSAVEALLSVARERPEELVTDITETWDDYWDLQLKAVQTLGLIGADHTAETLLAILDTEEEQDIECEILTALSRGDDDCIEALINRARTAAPRSRRRAVGALAQANSPAARSCIIDALDDRNADVRIAALDALVRIAATDQLDRIFDGLKDPVAEVRGHALKAMVALARVGGQGGIGPERLLPLLKIEDKVVRAATLEALHYRIREAGGELDPTVLPTLLDAVRSEDYDEAVAACALLAAIRTREVRLELVALMQDEDLDMRLRQQAIRSLAGHQNRELEAVMALLQAVRDPGPALRVSAVEALYQLQQVDSDSTADDEEAQKVPVPAPGQLLLELLQGEDPLTELEAALREQEIAAASEQLQQPPSGDLIATTATTATPLPGADNGQLIRDAQPVVEEPQQQAANSDGDEAAAIPADYPDDYADLDDDGDQPFSAGSTLDSITMDNIQTMLESRDERPDDEALLERVDSLPEEMQPFGDVVRKHLETGDRLFATRRKGPISEDARLLVVRTLADSDDLHNIEALVAALSDNNADICREAALALAVIAKRNPATEGVSNAFGALVNMLQYDNQDLRHAGLRAIGALQHKEGIVPAMDALGDPESSVRIEAIRTLAILAGSEFSEHKDSHHMVLESFGREDITTVIRPALEDPAEGVRKAAAEALTVLGDTDAADQMIDAALTNHGALATPIGHCLRQLDPGHCSDLLLLRMASLSESSQRRFVIEMLEALYRPDRHSEAA